MGQRRRFHNPMNKIAPHFGERRNELSPIGLSPKFRDPEFAMLKAGFVPSIVPYGADQTVYLVMDNSGSSGSVCRETEIERADPEAVISDLLSGQFNDPVRVVAFNTLEHWSKDLSEEIASEIQTRCDIAGDGVPDHLQDFVERHRRHDRQLALRLA